MSVFVKRFGLVNNLVFCPKKVNNLVFLVKRRGLLRPITSWHIGKRAEVVTTIVRVQFVIEETIHNT